MTIHNCELCGQPVRVVGETTLHYEPAPEQLTRPGDGDLIKSLETTVLEQSDQIESLSAECERYRRVVEQQAAKIERLTYGEVEQLMPDGSWRPTGAKRCRHCSQLDGESHVSGCIAGEE